MHTLLDHAGSPDTRDVRDALDSCAVLAVLLVKGTSGGEKAASAALKILLGVNTLPRPSCTTDDTTRRVPDWALRVRRREVTLVVALAGACLENTTLPVTLCEGPSADTLRGEKERMGKVSVRAVEATWLDNATVRLGVGRELARLGAGEVQVACPVDELRLARDGGGKGEQREESSSKSGLHLGVGRVS